DRWEFLLTNKEQVRLEFVFYDFPHLKLKTKWQGILIDSFDDLIANKTMALFDRSQPKDLYDVYCLITQKKIKTSTLLKNAERKFKVKINESNLWSASQKALLGLTSLEPFLLVGNKAEKEKILKDIKNFVASCSSLYLHGFLK
ncbi:MAG: nucleotidyl transferase AbiEii/AbiGii toxin family protein, partial [bacterium]|nr:nucleotidyl transferase AbiEii/AbiGii toxin family protein [bacterium]